MQSNDLVAQTHKYLYLEKSLGYTFKKIKLLECALTHPSAAKDDNYERLEFLGDAVLELSISELIYRSFPDCDEGRLTKLRAGIVCSKTLADLARNIELGKFIILGKGEETTGGRNKTSILENSMEAVLGAIFLDSDYHTASKIITALFSNVVNTVNDYKSFLQEEVQKRFKSNVSYKQVSAIGPQHDQVFTADVFLGDKKLGSGCGKSKKEAEQCAAKAALKELKIHV